MFLPCRVAHNKVKCTRTTLDDSGVNYRLANQKNGVLSLAGLFALHRLMLTPLNPDAHGVMERSSIFILAGGSDKACMQAFYNYAGVLSMRVDEGDA